MHRGESPESLLGFFIKHRLHIKTKTWGASTAGEVCNLYSDSANVNPGSCGSSSPKKKKKKTTPLNLAFLTNSIIYYDKNRQSSVPGSKGKKKTPHIRSRYTSKNRSLLPLWEVFNEGKKVSGNVAREQIRVHEQNASEVLELEKGFYEWFGLLIPINQIKGRLRAAAVQVLSTSSDGFIREICLRL